MRKVEEVISDIGYCIDNLKHLVRVNEKWTTDLSSIDKESRPVGYANQLEGIRQQERAFKSESNRLIALEAEQWLSSLGELNKKELESLKALLKSASAEVQKRLKAFEKDSGTEDNSLF